MIRNLILLILIVGCNNDYVLPKPKAYLYEQFEENQEYYVYDSECGFSFIANKSSIIDSNGCNLKMHNTDLKSTIFFTIVNVEENISLIQKDFDNKEMENLQAQMMSGKFNLEGMLKQFLQMKKMGGMSGLMSYMPGVGKIKSMMENADFDEKIIDHQIAIIRSMTKQERSDPDILKASRKRRIASGSGRQVHEVNRLLKQFEQTKKMMKQAQKPGFANKIKNLLGGNQMPTIE